MGQDDPEKRITDPELPLTEQEQPCSASNSDPAQRRFVVTAVPNARQYYTFGWLLVVASVFPIAQLFREGFGTMTAYGTLIFPVMLVGLAVLWFLALRRLWMKKLVICVAADGLIIVQRPADVFSLGDAELGQWRSTPWRGENLVGRALYLASGPHRFVLGEEGSRSAGGVPIEGPQVKAQHLDAWTGSSAFDELLAIIGSARGG